jgi:hypothetical protein
LKNSIQFGASLAAETHRTQSCSLVIHYLSHTSFELLWLLRRDASKGLGLLASRSLNYLNSSGTKISNSGTKTSDYQP